ncbi:MAG: hypothetical protein F7C36_02155 [Desulfurococcales archaeon]|nr:hypothetical protein [Desulfurococcales archaeon]
MPRIIVFKENKPKLIEGPNGEILNVCMCGLTDLYPYCTGKHIHIDEKDHELYAYDQEAKPIGKIIVAEKDSKQPISPDRLRSISLSPK